MEAYRIEHKLAAEIGTTVANAFYNFGKLLRTWTERALSDLQLRFGAEADKYRAQLIRLDDSRRISQDEQFSIRRDLEQLSQSQAGPLAQMSSVS